MQINKEIVDNLIQEFSLIENKNTIDEKNLTKFNNNNKEDLLYLSFINTKKNDCYITFLNFLVKKIKPQNIVELGNREGLSTLSIYDAIKKSNSDFYSVDIEKDLRYCPEHMFNDPQMHFLFGDVCSLEIINKLPRKIDLLFTDTLHFDFQIRDEWEIYQNLLSDIALVAIDDININDKRKLFDELPFTKWELAELCHSSGWGLFLFERKSPVGNDEQSKNIYESTIRVWERKYESLFKKVEETTNKKIFSIIKKTIKRIKPVYKLYTYIFNNTSQLLNKGNKLKYPGSVRL